MTTTLIILSSIITITAAIPYLIEIVRGKAKPRIMSWFTWTLITAIASAASFADHQYPAAILSLCAAVETFAVVVLGFKHGNRKFETIDIVCQIGAIMGLVVWLVFNSPAIAVIATVIVDFIGAIPTLIHAWRKPHEETWLSFLLSSVGGGLTVFVAGSWKVTAIAYPLYLLLMNALIAGLILTRLCRLKA